MAKKGDSKGSIWDNPFGGAFDINGDGKEDFIEQMLALKVFEECTKESTSHDYSSDYTYNSILDDDEDFIDTSWRDFCEDGWDYDIDPEDYDTEEEYEEALQEAKTAWRDTCEDGSEYSLDPEDYDTEEEYEEALQEAKTAWRDTCEDGSEYGLDPEDYETEKEYEEALAEAKEKIAWRDTCEDGSDYDIDPEDYDTEEEYNDALQEARTEWRDICEDGSEYDLDPDDFEAEEEYEEALSEAKEKFAWRDTCEDGSEYYIDPEDYDTEEEYEEALQEAKTAWRDTCEDGSEYDLDPEYYETEAEYMEALENAQNGVFSSNAPSISLSLSVECPALDKLKKIKEEDFPNKRRFKAAYNLANEFHFYGDKEVERREKACCQFILDKADTVVAANYLSYEDGFLYAQAIKNNFKLPVSLPDEDENREYEFEETLCKIAKRNIELSFEVWEWSLATFLPYTQYADGSLSELTSSVIDDLDSFPEGYRTELARYMDKHPEFMEKVVDEKAEMASGLDELIVAALQDGLLDTALALFKRGLAQAGDDWKKINRLVDGTIYYCENYDELESAEYFKLNMLPLVKAINIGMVRDEIDEWEKDLDRYIRRVENDCEKYTYTRKNSWRKTVPDGSKYGLDTCDYDSEKEYMEALNEEKYGWREWYKDDDTLGLNVNEFETQEEYQKAYDARLNEKRQRELEQRKQKWKQLQQQRDEERREQLKNAQRIEAEKARADDKIYIFCGVTFPGALHPYHYRTEDPTIQVGDTVLVPAGDEETIGKVVSVGQYMRIAAPYPVDKTKFIIRKMEEESK